ncbi:MAG TPA: radical SAM protein, partial [Candidatus Glassbacteria bacterium]|nr:radical SAM protein [Candidatus Glassbacteria bacterium]
RVGALDRGLVELLRRCRVASLTLAPETASRELLSRLGKNYREEELFDSVDLLAQAGFRSLKLYYMIGLPGETEDHRGELVDQVGRLARAAGKRLRLKISVNPFIPKPQTAWQDESMLRPQVIKRLLRGLRQGLRAAAPGVVLVHDPLAEILSQAALSLGDRSFSRPLEQAGAGSRLLDCIERCGIDLEPVVFDRKKPAIEHPWWVIEGGDGT